MKLHNPNEPHKCDICQLTKEYTHQLPVLSADGTHGEYDLKDICNSCWEIVSELSKRANTAELTGLHVKIEQQGQQIVQLGEFIETLTNQMLGLAKISHREFETIEENFRKIAKRFPSIVLP